MILSLITLYVLGYINATGDQTPRAINVVMLSIMEILALEN